MGRHFLIFGFLSLVLLHGYSAEISMKDAEEETVAMVDDMMVTDRVTMEETKKETLMMEKPVMSDSTEIIKEQPVVEDAMELNNESPMITATIIDEQSPGQMMADQSIPERPSEQIILEDVKEPVMADPMAMETLMSADEDEFANVEDQLASARGMGYITAADAIKRIYEECLQRGSFACVKPKVLAFLSAAAKKDRIMLTQDLSIEKTGKYYPSGYDYQQWNGATPARAEAMLERIDDFVNNHELKLRVPKEVVSGELLPFVPKFLLQSVPAELRVPLSDSNGVTQERGFIKKIVLPFLLGLKFKATALIPLALALIALKTWKALTLGLLSIVLSGAMVIFKFTKPKVVNYEVIHYPHAPAPIIEHAAPASYDHHGYGRGFDAQPLVYRAYRAS